MIKIGDFARLAGVSVETLRHYDELGLLTPVKVDQFTGYRLYSAAQLARVNRILALKDFGFSLRQIGEALDGLTLEQLFGMLKMSRAQAELALADERARLTRIESRLKQMEQEKELSEYDVVLKEVPKTLVASCRVTIPTNDQVARVLGGAFDAAYGLVRGSAAKETGPCLALWHQPASVLVNEDAEAAVQIDRAVTGSEQVRVYEIPATQVISVIHQGSYSNFKQAHAVLLSWMESNGYEMAGPIREVYVHEAKPDESAAVTEIQYPVTKAG